MVKIKEIVKMNINALSTASARLDAPENAVSIVLDLSEIIINKCDHDNDREQQKYTPNH